MAVVKAAAQAFVWLACQWDASAYSYVEASVELHIHVFCDLMTYSILSLCIPFPSTMQQYLYCFL
jgi:hypothetical protein